MMNACLCVSGGRHSCDGMGRGAARMSRAVARAALLHMLPDYLASAGVSPDSIFRQAGMSLDDVASAAVVSRSQIHHALALSARCVGIAEVGLLLGRSADPAKLGPIGKVLATARGATAEACLQAQIDLMPTMQSHVSIALLKRDTEMIWTHRLVGDDETAWLLHEGAVAFNVGMLRNLMGADWAPEHVSFPHACRGLRRSYEDHFQAPVSFGDQGEARIHMARSPLSRPLQRASHPDRGRDVGPASTGPVTTIRRGASDIESAVERMIDATLADRPVTLQMAARILGLSPRTLQRRLDDNGRPFEQLLDDRRRVLAMSWLKDGGTSVTGVAMRLGYSDVAHFNRAFRRWEGRSPMGFRRASKALA